MERGPRPALYAGRGASANERPVARSFGPQAPARAGLLSTGPEDAARGWREDADGVTALLARRVPLVLWRTLRTRLRGQLVKSQDVTSFAGLQFCSASSSILNSTVFSLTFRNLAFIWSSLTSS